MRRRLFVTAATLVAIGLTTASAAAQTAPQDTRRSIAVGMHSQSFSFGDSADAERAQLFLFPIAFQQRIGSLIAVDGYAAWARGTVHAGGEQYDLDGPVDSWMRIRVAASRWAVLAFGVSFPTGVEKHDSRQGVVANILSNDLLGYREANWGAGLSMTGGISTVAHVGPVRFTVGGSYRKAETFNPRTDTTWNFSPGSETRARVGWEVPVGAGRVEGGLTYQTFTVDRLNDKNLFQPGVRYRADLSYNVGGWSIYAADMFRDRGEVTVPVINVLDGTFVRDTLFGVGWQNLVVAGVTGRIGPVYPSIDGKMRHRPGQIGRGWIASGGAMIPFAIRRTEVFPSFKFSRGAAIPAGDSTAYRQLWGAEVSIVLRRSK
jgi:hypothetical protein